ncbi:MAG TPA: glycoside hydrolase family 2 TIM barrel-domain containing protein, partial [Cryomorphaceae bacterium]|nr:glycoside hydrolase family 2 TIM barrel-domain containing protein [Cryomorphaceae bacterium]
PYYIKGIGGQGHLDKAVAYGANSVRTWGVSEAIAVLDDAHEKGLSVLFGLWVGCERQGFDYDDTKAVKAQLARFTEVVKAYKDHPAILMWGIGNETDLFYSDFKVWNAINDIAKMIHEEDPNHPTMTVTAGLDVAEIQLIKERAPHIDVMGINTYGGLLGMDKEIRAYGWEGPYVITEWGPNGHWEVPKTTWGAPVEQTSTEKAASYKERYQKGILDDKEMCVGSYVFLWGQKQETTPTWYGLFLADGTETAVMDVIQKGWSGELPENQSPQIDDITINGKGRYESVYVKPGDMATLMVTVEDPDGDDLSYRWEILPESTDIKSGGDKEAKPEPVSFNTKPSGRENVVNFKVPKKEGAYRFFAYIYDGNGNAAVANIPFYVEAEKPD